jgi:hypothetical protein
MIKIALLKINAQNNASLYFEQIKEINKKEKVNLSL